MSLKRGDIVMVSDYDRDTAFDTPHIFAVFLHKDDNGNHVCVDAEDYEVSSCGPLEVDVWAYAVPTGESIYDKNPMDIRVPLGYEELASVLQEAIEQASSGKGKERHAVGEEAFQEQLICHLSKQVGVAGPVFQVVKKAVESCRLPYPRSKAELLGAIVYAAAAVMELDRQNVGNA